MKQETKDLLTLGWYTIQQAIAALSGIFGILALLEGDYQRATFNMLMMHILHVQAQD